MIASTVQKHSNPTMNTTRLITGCLALASLMGLAQNLHAQTTAFTYQGRLTDSNGPATGQHDFELRLFNAVTGGAQQGSTVEVNNLSVSNGLFTASLDFGAAVFPGADRFLQIAVRTNGGGAFSALAPRQALTPTPYAVFAGKVNASGISGTLAPGNIANGTITTLMLANGAVGSNQLAAGAVTTTALANGAVTATKVATVTNWFALTIANPTPEAFDSFGNSVAALGSDRVLIGAFGDNTGAASAGAAYLFSTNGTLLTTFNNPTPAANDLFGEAVAAVGNDRVLIGAPEDNTGAPDAGAAYLFSTNGMLLTTFINPTLNPDDRFGNAVAAVGSDRVLIGAFGDNTGAASAGAAYLFSLETFTDGLVADAVRARSITTASLEDGAVTAAKISGVLFPSQIPILALDASEITSGTLADARLSTNVAFRNTPQTFKRLTVAGAGAFNSPNAAAIILDNTTPVTGRRWEWHALDNGKMQLADFDAAATRLVIDTAGNVGIGTASPASALQVVGTVTATAFNPPSDRNLKENFAPVSPREVLDKVTALPISRWNFKGDAATPHVGPMAQDFHAAFGLGTDERHIATVDADGVALAAIQGLNSKVEVGSQKTQGSIQKLQEENAELKLRLEKLERLMSRQVGGAR